MLQFGRFPFPVKPGMSHSDRRSIRQSAHPEIHPLPQLIAACHDLLQLSSRAIPQAGSVASRNFLPLHLCDYSSGVQDMSIFGISGQPVSPQGESASTTSPIMSACWGALSIRPTYHPYMNTTEQYDGKLVQIQAPPRAEMRRFSFKIVSSGRMEIAASIRFDASSPRPRA